MIEMLSLLNKLDRRGGATESLIAESERDMGIRFPDGYVEFLRLSNGGEGFIGNSSYAILWNVEELSSMNRSYEIDNYVPGLIIFGSDGGGEAYGFDTRQSQLPIVRVPFVGMDWNVAKPMGTSFRDFLEQLYEAE